MTLRRVAVGFGTFHKVKGSSVTQWPLTEGERNALGQRKPATVSPTTKQVIPQNSNCGQLWSSAKRTADQWRG
jgi:hypothetical protein